MYRIFYFTYITPRAYEDVSASIDAPNHTDTKTRKTITND